MADVFISYSRDDQAIVRPLAEAVRRAGFSLWWDDELPPHRAYGDVIAEQIAAAKAAIVVWSASAAASQWVRAEADAARNGNKLVQVAIDATMPPLPFTMLHAVSIADWRGEEDHPGWRKVKESLELLCGGEAVERPSYPMPTKPPPPTRHKYHGLLIAVIALSFLFIAGAGLLAWLGRGEPPAAAVAPDGPKAAPRPAPGQARPVPPPKAAPRPAPPRGATRYCLGPGRGTPACARLRARYGRRQPGR